LYKLFSTAELKFSSAGFSILSNIALKPPSNFRRKSALEPPVEESYLESTKVVVLWDPDEGMTGAPGAFDAFVFIGILLD